ncbi:MAG: hypothetical protein ACTSQN_11775 [Candidatus Heimdallarchaeota archaeon]
MTYVPPEKKQKGGTSSFGDVVYVILFYLVEGAFVFIGVPILVVAIGFIPIAMYLIITGGGNYVDYILYGFVVVIVFFQILALQYFFKRYILIPNKMTFRQWVVYRFSPSEIRKRRDEKRARSQKMSEWYDGMDRIHERNEQYKEEQQSNLRADWFGEGNDPEDLIGKKQDDGIIIVGFESESGSEFETETQETPIVLGNDFETDDSPIVLGTDTETEESDEIEFIKLGSDEEDEEN